jgi:hypothetical protein
MTILEKLNSVPPIFCRLVARTKNGRRGLTTSELEKASGLSRTTVKELSFRTTWNNVTVEVAHKFMSACGVNPLAARRQREFARRRKLVHVEQATGAQKRMYDRIESVIVAEAEKRKLTK